MMKKLSLITFIIFNFQLLIVFAQNPEIDSLENLLQKHQKKDTVRINLLNETANKLYRVEIDKTLKYATEAGEIADKLSFTKGKAESQKNIGIYYAMKLDYSKASEYYQKSLKIYEELEDKYGISNCYNNIGNMYWYQSNYSKAMEYYQKSLKINEESGTKHRLSENYFNIGLIYSTQGNYPKAMEYYQKSLKIDEELDNNNGISECYNSMAEIYYFQNDYPKAMEYLQKSLKISLDLDDKRDVSNCFGNIGNIYKKLGSYSKTLEYLHKSLKISEELGDKAKISMSFNDIGEIYKIQDDYPKALEYYQKSLKISIELGGKSMETRNYIGLGSLYLKQKKTKEAYNFAKKAYTLAKEIGEAELIKESSETLAKSCETLGLYKEAYKYHVIFKIMNDSLYNEENVKEITGMEYQYKFDKEKQAIELEQQKKDAVQAEEAKRQKTFRNSFIIGFILMLILVVVVLRSFMQKRKANRILTAQKNEIEEKNAELLGLNEEIQTQAEQLEVTNQELAKLSIVASETDNGVTIVNNAGKIEWINEGFTKMFGYNLQELFQNKGDSIINSSHSVNIKTHFNECIKEKKSVVYSTLNETKSGKEIWVQTTLTPVLDDNGNIKKLLAIDSDITKIKEAEAQIKEQNAEIQEIMIELNAQKQKITDSIRYAKKIQNAILPSN